MEEIIFGEGGGCRKLAELSHFHMDLFGNYIPGLCSGLTIHRDDLAKPIKEGAYPIITRLFSEGIGAFLSFAEERFGFRPSRPF